MANEVSKETIKKLQSLFSDENFSSDQYLQSLAINEKGWIPIVKLRTFKRFEFLGKQCVTAIISALEEIPSYLLEIDATKSFIRRRSVPSRIRAYVHYLFSDANWSRDLHLQTIAEENQGLVPIQSHLLSFRLMKKILDFNDAASTPLQREAIVCGALESSRIVESVGLEGLRGIRAKSLATRIRQQIEYYFSDQNYFKDHYLIELASENDGQFVTISELLSWPRMRQMVLPQVADVARVLDSSSLVELSTDRLSVRKRSIGSAPAGEIPTTVDLAEGAAVLDDGSSPPAGGGGSAAKLPEEVADTAMGVFSAVPSPREPRPGFKVIQFNILADFLCKPHYMPYADPAVLAWSHRFPLLLQMLEHEWDADLVMLQEVQSTRARQHPHNHATLILREARRLGYEGVYFRKTFADWSQPDKATIGNLVLYRADVFHAIDKGTIAFAPLLAARCTSQAQRDWYAKGAQGAAYALLIHTASRNPLLVASTHISCNYQNPDTQVAQVATLVADLETKRDAAAIHIAKTDSALTPEGGLPVLICGDFNATPGSSSYELLSEGALDEGHPDLRPNDHSVAPIFTNAGAGAAVAGVRHGLRLSSAYVAVTGQEPDVTNVKGPPEDFHACLDYIWHSPSLLPTAVEPVAPLPVLAQQGGGLPNATVPSDHVPIGAHFFFRN